MTAASARDGAGLSEVALLKHGVGLHGGMDSLIVVEQAFGRGPAATAAGRD